MKIGDTVQIKDYRGSTWRWLGRSGILKRIDTYCINQYCFVVELPDGEIIRDVMEHFK